MATTKDTVSYILEQLKDLPDIRARPMFGEYALYCNDRVVALICDDHLFVKCTPAGTAYAQGRYEEGFAYPGAKPSMDVTDAIDDKEFLSELIRKTAYSLPKKPKKIRQ